MSPTYDEIRAFAIIAQHRSFRRASCELNVSPSALSHKMRSIEERLGVRLLNRTTRSVTPTEAGERLLSSFTPLQEQIKSMLDSISQFRESAVCTLRLNMPGQALHLVIAPILPRFLAANPRVIRRRKRPGTCPARSASGAALRTDGAMHGNFSMDKRRK